MDLEKLTRDCADAKRAALAAIENMSDDGTCNLDATVLRIEKGVRSRAVVEAIQAAGLTASVTNWLGRGIFIGPPGNGQANQRSVSNGMVYKTLSEAGWRVTAYYQMD